MKTAATKAPSFLAFASAVRRSWRSVVHDDKNFLRSFRAAHNNVPSLLGFFSNEEGDTRPIFTSITTGPMNLALPSSLDGHPTIRLYACCHGRMLLDGRHHGELLVWDPLTRAEQFITMPRSFTAVETHGAALICDADHGNNHRDCHSSPFRVAIAYSNRPSDWHEPMAPKLTISCVYSSERGSWSGWIDLGYGCYFDREPGVMVGNVMYWTIDSNHTVLGYHLETHSLTRIETPDDMRLGNNFVLMPTMDEFFGFIDVGWKVRPVNFEDGGRQRPGMGCAYPELLLVWMIRYY